MSTHDASHDRSSSGLLARARVDSVAGPLASPTDARTATVQRHSAGDGGMLAEQVGKLPEPLRLQMALIARQATDSDAALAPIIELLIDGSPAKRAAIVTAFRTNDPLREQWERTFEILRAG